ncbi:MAG: sigma-70 family RNA polymerase sigma factor [Planctomycetes bacterium]|nr:sigma-70 family RNA polymerase sigma factor [Planctomycetota bacterium]
MTSNESRSGKVPASVTSTSRSLLMQLKQKEPRAWDRLTSLYTPLVYFWCRKQHLQDQDIPDVVQEVFKTVAANIDKFRKERQTDTFRGWLRTITRSRAADHFRRLQHQPKAAGGSEAQRRFSQLSAEPIECNGSDDDEVEDGQVHHALFLRALELVRSDFQDNTWRAFWRVVVDGQTPKDVAEELSMQPGAVRVAKSRVLQRLRRDLGELLE